MYSYVRAQAKSAAASSARVAPAYHLPVTLYSSMKIATHLSIYICNIVCNLRS